MKKRRKSNFEDKVGHPIYEDDICEVDGVEPYLCVSFWSKGWVVVYPTTCRSEMEGEPPTDLLSDVITKVLVVGNLYDNPSLLDEYDA